MNRQSNLRMLVPTAWQDYELLDSGDGRKLERYGTYILIRPEAQASWAASLPREKWKQAHATFIPLKHTEGGGRWHFHKHVPAHWQMSYRTLRFVAQTTAGRHLGVFPEQAVYWDWINKLVRSSGRPIRVLNLFGYTGLASLAAAQAGAQVTHIDASNKAIRWAKKNQELSKLEDRPIRWLTDDVRKFVKREIRRGVQYEAIILDPPKFGRGPKGEVWEFFKHITQLLSDCRSLLSENPLFVALTAYAINYTAAKLRNLLQDNLRDLGGQFAAGELALRDSAGDRVIPTALYARWSTRKSH